MKPTLLLFSLLSISVSALSKEWEVCAQNSTPCENNFLCCDLIKNSDGRDITGPRND